MNVLCGNRFGALAIALALQNLPAQITPPRDPKPITIRAQSRLVVVDVVVQDKDRNPVQHLKQEDFALTENSVSQRINSFEEHQPRDSEMIVQEESPPLPPGTFTNRQAAPKGAALNVVLIDVMNTPIKDQPFLRKQVSQYLATAAHGNDLAVFQLNSHLVMLQGFTSDPLMLKHAIDSSVPERSKMLSDAAETGSTPVTITQQIQDAGMDKYIPAKVQAQMQSTEDRIAANQTQTRVKITLDGLNALARYLAGVPGRKNLIWFSGSFPVNVLPHIPLKYRNNPDFDAFASQASSVREYRQTVNLFARAQVAVYPVDSRGLMTSSAIDIQSSGNGFSTSPQQFAANEADFSNENADAHSTLERMARDTGGRAFINTNDFKGAIRTAVKDGSSFYTLTYHPSDVRWHGDLRAISVKLAQRGYTLHYRHSYYADDPDSVASALSSPPGESSSEVHGRLDESDLIRVMAHGVPSMAEVAYTESILPVSKTTGDQLAKGNIVDGPGFAKAKPPYWQYRIDFRIDPHSLVLKQSTDGGSTGLLEFVSTVYTRDGETVARISNQVQLVLTPKQYALLMRQELPFLQEISVPATGQYSIRTGVLDINSRHVGAIEVPVDLVINLPPVVVEPTDKKPATLKTRPQP